MNGKRARNIRKLLKLKLPAKADLRVSGEVEKYVYTPKPITGDLEMVKVKRTSIVNATKFKYNKVKKHIKGHKVPSLDKKDTLPEKEE